MAAIPLMLIPFILYNLAMVGAFGGGGTAALETIVTSVNMMSGATWTMSLGDLFIVIALIILFLEIFKATRRSSVALLDHLFSMALFVVFLVEFLLVQGAATQIFFILMLISLVDVIAGFTVSIKSASRDVAIGL
ncbi:hypothetical protein IHQ71_25250 [Rhizobium sp. TH2]|uniref:hypothetical protein n=1 Tax=Rhizobium sp. TH2 TaxID=2775403 RepID=UPI0021573C47|nr:hypothetical protein [Rhizobium sp. TH2]UVC08416.1 hypothetical protein IHQ71_25250 [Rhizobium sp. TH2]